MVCRIKGPAIVDIVNTATAFKTLQLKLDGGLVRLDMSPNDAASIFVAEELEYTELGDVSIKAASLTGEPITPECE